MKMLDFSSSELPEEHRIKATEDIWSSVFNMDVDIDSSEEPLFQLQACQFPGLSIAHGKGSKSLARISKAPVQAVTGSDALVLCVTLDTEICVRTSKQERIYAPGEAHLWLSNQSISCDIHSNFSALLLSLPTNIVEATCVDIDRVVNQGIARQSAEFNLLLSYAQMVLRDINSLSAQAASSALSHLRELIFLTLSSNSERQKMSLNNSMSVARLARIKEDICANLLNQALCAEWIATREGISSRYLRDLFAMEDTSFTDYVMEKKLVLAWRRLTDSRFRDKTVSSIAYDCGFGDLSYFGRVFKRHFGFTPSAARAECRKFIQALK